MVPSAWKLVLYGLVILVGSLIALPNLLTPAQREALPDWLPDTPVALGLDLRGGAHLVLEIDASRLRREQMETLLGDAQAVLRDARVGGIRGAIEADTVVLRANTPQIAAAAERALRASDQGRSFAEEDRGCTGWQHPAVARACCSRGARAIGPAAKRRNRSSPHRAIGVAEPTVQALGSTRILVQLPGVQDPASIRTLLGRAAAVDVSPGRIPRMPAVPEQYPPDRFAFPPRTKLSTMGFNVGRSYRASGSCTQAPASIRKTAAELSRFVSMMQANECSRRSLARTSGASWPLFSMAR